MEISISKNISCSFDSSMVLNKSDFINITRYMYDKVSSSFLSLDVSWSEITVTAKNSKTSYSLDEFINNFSLSEKIVSLSIMIGLSNSSSYVSINFPNNAVAYLTINSTVHTKAQIEDLIHTLDNDIFQILKSNGYQNPSTDTMSSQISTEEQPNVNGNHDSSTDSNDKTFLRKPIVFWTGITAIIALVALIIGLFK